MYGIILIIAVVAISGLIAYVGDKIGMKVGKKRISIFGLRPKYTSIIITILTGVLIATLTLTIILVTNNGVRRAIFRIQEVLTRIETLNEQLQTKDQQLKGMKEEIETNTQELEQLQQQRDTLESKLNATQKEYDNALTDLRQARDNIEQLKQNRAELQERVTELRDQVDGLKNQVTGLKAQRQDLEKTIGELNDTIGELNDKITQLTNSYEQAKELASRFQASTEYYMTKYYMGEELVYKRGDIIYSDIIQGGQTQDQIIRDITQYLEKANEEVKKQPVKVNENGNALRLSEEEIFSVAKTILNYEGRVIVNLVAIVNVPKDDWVTASFSLNRDFIVFQQGELIASTTIEANLPPDQLENKLENLLRDISIRATKKGVLADNQGSVISVDFSRFYQILNQIQSFQGQVKIKVYATEDIWRENRLSTNLKFEIEQLTDSSRAD